MKRYSFKQRFYLFLAGTIIPVLIYLFGATWRVSFVNPKAEKCGPPLVWAFWHARMLPLLYYFRRREIVVLVSRSFDGEIIARVLRSMGFRTLRGSSSRGAVESLKSAVKELKSGAYLAFTPDGPRGPAEKAKVGAAAASALSGAPMIAVATSANRTWRLSSWDKFIIPKPFAKIEIRQSEPIFPEKRKAMELNEILQNLLDETTRKTNESMRSG